MKQAALMIPQDGKAGEAEAAAAAAAAVADVAAREKSVNDVAPPLDS
jgi:hypothetical protein